MEWFKKFRFAKVVSTKKKLHLERFKNLGKKKGFEKN